MTVIEKMSRAEVVAERAEIESRLRVRFGTSDRDELRDASTSGDMSFEDTELVERLRTLDFLIHDE